MDKENCRRNYLRICIPNGDHHHSYHESGERHFVSGEKIQLLSHSMKLSEFKGVAQLSGGAFTKDLRLVPYSAYDMDKVDGAVYTDTRTFQKEFINLDLQIVESGRMDLIYRFPDTRSQMTIFTETNPWLAIQFW